LVLFEELVTWTLQNVLLLFVKFTQ